MPLKVAIFFKKCNVHSTQYNNAFDEKIQRTLNLQEGGWQGGALVRKTYNRNLLRKNGLAFSYENLGILFSNLQRGIRKALKVLVESTLQKLY